MKSQQSKALPPITEILENGHMISDTIREKMESNSLSKKEAKELVEELDECIQLMEDLKKSLATDSKNE